MIYSQTSLISLTVSIVSFVQVAFQKTNVKSDLHDPLSAVWGTSKTTYSWNDTSMKCNRCSFKCKDQEIKKIREGIGRLNSFLLTAFPHMYNTQKVLCLKYTFAVKHLSSMWWAIVLRRLSYIFSTLCWVSDPEFCG